MSRVKNRHVKVISGQLRSNIKPLKACQISEKVSSKENYGVFSFFKLYYSCMFFRGALSIKTCENIIITNITIYNL